MAKSLKMLTIASILSTAVTFNLSPAVANSSPLCEIKQISRSIESPRIDLKVGDRKIVILGWQHLSPSSVEENQIAQYLNSAGAAAKRKDCSSAARNLQELLMFQQVSSISQHDTELWC